MAQLLFSDGSQLSIEFEFGIRWKTTRNATKLDGNQEVARKTPGQEKNFLVGRSFLET